MRAGQLRHRVTIQSRSTTPDTYGQPALTWTDWQDVSASIAPLAGREAITADAVQSSITHRIRLRYLEGLTVAHRIVFGSRIFDIQSVADISERNREMEVFATEGPSAG